MGGPWTWSTEGVHGPGVHILYFPPLRANQIARITSDFKMDLIKYVILINLCIDVYVGCLWEASHDTLNKYLGKVKYFCGY